jgi:hypothetical protein
MSGFSTPPREKHGRKSFYSRPSVTRDFDMNGSPLAKKMVVDDYESPDEMAFNAPVKKNDMMSQIAKDNYAKGISTPLKFEMSPASTHMNTMSTPGDHRMMESPYAGSPNLFDDHSVFYSAHRSNQASHRSYISVPNQPSKFESMEMNMD